MLQAAAHLVISRGGEAVLLHLLSGNVESARFEPGSGFPQRELRLRYQEALRAEESVLHAELRRSLAPFVGDDLAAAASAHAEPSGGHLFCVYHDASPSALEALGRVHRIEEGNAEDHYRLLSPEGGGASGFAHLGWSYTTLAGSRLALLYRTLFPVLAVNLAWYRYRQLRGDIIALSRAIQGVHSDRDLIAQTEFYNQVVLDVKIWEAERDSYERGLQPVFRSVYDRLWKYWDTGESRETVHEGINYLRDFLDRKFSVKMTVRETTQAKILFVIALFQLLSVFGIVSGYLYFWERTPLPENVIFQSAFTSWVTILSPIFVLGLILWLLVVFFRQHR
jgi:hypothetical protein